MLLETLQTCHLFFAWSNLRIWKLAACGCKFESSHVEAIECSSDHICCFTTRVVPSGRSLADMLAAVRPGVRKHALIAHARLPVLEIVLALRKHGLRGDRAALGVCTVRLTRLGALVLMHEVIRVALNERAFEEETKSKARVAACNSVHTLILSYCRQMRLHWGASCNLSKARQHLQFRMRTKFSRCR